MTQPKTYRGVTVSSTFTDLKKHREKVIEAIEKFDMKAVVMESVGARADLDVIDSSLELVRRGAAYVGVISRKYGQNPYCKDRNPERLSITELEFNEAMRLNRPILLFLMGEDHPGKESDFELDPEKRKKLAAFRERAKQMRPDSEVHRIYEAFDSLEQFGDAAATAIGRLVPHLAAADLDGAPPAPPEPDANALPRPPALAALPNYAGSHKFVGRTAELQTLNDWAGAADPSPMLLFEAMGGSGKSMLTWEWVTRHAPQARSDWAGLFWYSFYEKGAVMADFCRQALAYITAKPAKDFVKLRTPELADRLLAELNKKPWLLVLDGLERVLVAYHRADAAQIPDDEAGTTRDQIGDDRDPLQAIRPEDDDLLTRLAAAAPSKILVSSRLTPAALVNRGRTPLPGVRREILAGLRPPDAEKLIRACGVSGDSTAIQAFLQSNCDCHPLVIGALAGLVNDYVPCPGDFDGWLVHPRYGGTMNLADLDLVQKRNHILDAALDALAEEGRQLLQTLALLQSGADYEMLLAFNPHLPPKPEEVEEPRKPEEFLLWDHETEEDRARMQSEYAAALDARQAFLAALAAWEVDPAVRAAPERLDLSVLNLRRRGLLQYDGIGNRYDLHPVVRGVASGRLESAETERLGQKVVDHFNGRPHDPWEQAETLADVEPGMEVVRVLLRMKRYALALFLFRDDLSRALAINLNANFELQGLLRHFFPTGWDDEPMMLDDNDTSWLLNETANTFADTHPRRSASMFNRTISLHLKARSATNLFVAISNLSFISSFSESIRLNKIATNVAYLEELDDIFFSSKVDVYLFNYRRGDRNAADEMWSELKEMERPSDRAVYRPGDAERHRALDLFQRGELSESLLAKAEKLALVGRNRSAVQALHSLRGEWLFSLGRPDKAASSLREAARMAREVGRPDHYIEARLAHARWRAGEEFDVRAEAQRLESLLKDSFALAELLRDLGERDRAVAQALNHHAWAVGDGEPFVYRYELDCCRAFLAELGAELPEVPVYDPASEKPFPWEADVRRFIAEIEAEREKAEAEEGDENT